MVISSIEKQYKKYLNHLGSRWEYGNSILYQMCKHDSKHDDADVIVGKIWLIGRSYAAAIERRKNADEHQGDDFYYDAVAPKLLEIGKELDDRISDLNSSDGKIAECVPLVLGTHRFLMDAFYELTGLEKRSLASKYLHFHCPDRFFIYDSRARVAASSIVQRPDKHILSELPTSEYDEEYGDFVCRMLELQGYLEEKLGILETPRRLDTFLLSAVK